MKTTVPVQSLAATAIALFVVVAIPTPGVGADVPTRVESTAKSVSAVVTVADHETRELSLRFPDGSVEEWIAGPDVARFDEVEVGDTVTIDYVNAIGLELRAPTAEEAAEPYVELEGDARTALEELPAGAIGKMIRAVATVEILDRIHNTATLQGPRGNQLTIQVANPANLSKVRIGETVVVTYAEAVIISLQKPAK